MAVVSNMCIETEDDSADGPHLDSPYNSYIYGTTHEDQQRQLKKLVDPYFSSPVRYEVFHLPKDFK